MIVVLYTIAFIVLGYILARCADWVVKAVSYFSHTLHVKSFLFGFLLLGFATTIPEMFVAYQSVLDGVPQLSVGNLLGGSILLLSFVMGVSAIFLKRIVLDHGMSSFDIAASAFVVAAPAIVIWDGNLTRLEGFALLCLYIVHLLFINKEQHVLSTVEQHARHVKHAGHAVLLGLGGIIGMAIASRFIVTIGEASATLLGIPTFVIGLFLITFGTNLPELTLAIEAIVQKKRDVAFGDILGSSVINTPLLGIICLVSPFTMPDIERVRMTLLLLAIVSVFFLWAASTKKDITRREGIMLFIVYIAFVLFEMTRV
ncbi:MAG: Na+/Ca+ antiporter, CaCA family [Microgenomates group bacterium GW2011_GWC1_39_12]|nr:MAG: Na+/Ca+ antiporter, CaCA family [Microgenomates group bacterium GW2011_GWC1_39_12]